MMVVADTGPLNYLILLGQVHLLQDHYGRVVIPSAVADELKHPHAPADVRTWISAPPAWVDILISKQIDRTLPNDLGPGEREAISLAMETHAAVLLIDDYAGRTEARLRNIEITGTLGILLRESQRSDLDFPSLITSLRSLGFRLSQEMAEKMIESYRNSR